MHNSQNGSGMEFSGTGPFKALVRGNCIGCHGNTTDTNTIKTIGSSNIPVVYNSSEPNYGPDYDSSGTLINTSGSSHTLAGGNFYWVTQSGGDPKGHNPKMIDSDGDATLSSPPGFDPNFGAGIGTSWSAGKLTCAGTYGCHGRHDTEDDFAAIYGAHHEDDSTIDGSTVGKSYRFLLGIVGKEDEDWEQTVAADDHNQYKGVDRTSDTTKDSSTISYLCVECHGYFHTENGCDEGIDPDDDMTHPWIRHPTDYDMGNTASSSEYRSYVGADGSTAAQYNIVAPVASADVSTVKSTVSFNDDTIVMCLSCHRAHGTPYDDILRWDYSKMNAGNGGNFANKGCFACHTTKD